MMPRRTPSGRKATASDGEAARPPAPASTVTLTEAQLQEMLDKAASQAARGALEEVDASNKQHFMDLASDLTSESSIAASIRDQMVHVRGQLTEMANKANTKQTPTTSSVVSRRDEFWHESFTLQIPFILEQVQTIISANKKQIVSMAEQAFYHSIVNKGKPLELTTVMGLVCGYARENGKMEVTLYEQLKANSWEMLKCETLTFLRIKAVVPMLNNLYREGRKKLYAKLRLECAETFEIDLTDIDEINTRHACLFYPQVEQDAKAYFPICEGLFEIREETGKLSGLSDEYDFGSLPLLTAVKNISTHYGCMNETDQDTGVSTPKVTLEACALVALRLAAMKSDLMKDVLLPFGETLFKDIEQVLNWMANPAFCPSVNQAMLQHSRANPYQEPPDAPSQLPKKRSRKRQQGRVPSLVPSFDEDDD